MEQGGNKGLLAPHKDADKAWYLALLDGDAQRAYEEDHLAAVLAALKSFYVARILRRINARKAEVAAIRARENYSAEDYRLLLEKNAEIAAETHKLNGYRCFFAEPYFARMDVVDPEEGYNSYYIGKKGDVNLEIVDWRAPLAVRYYQKSRVRFSINEYEYRTVLRRALSVKNGKLLDFKNEYLSVGDVLTPEEIGGRDEEILFDPYLRSIIKSRQDDVHVRDIIRTIQEKQFEVITRPERDSFVLQGCAGSGKTMILLHRLSYLMYNNEKLHPRDVLVITPSDSFNAFIDELAQVLELERVRTVTLRDYYVRVLANDGIGFEDKIGPEREPQAYLDEVYSPRFPEEIAREVEKLYGDVRGLFDSEECREVSERVLAGCIARRERFVRIKNASTRIRRAVLGEMKETKEDGFYFTKPFRGIMSAFAQAEDFLVYVLREPPRTPDAFFRQFAEFYRSAHLVSARAESVFEGAKSDLDGLAEVVRREIADLKRYRLRREAGEVYTYADRIARREELLAEIARIRGTVGEMGEGLELFREFFSVVRLTGRCAELGKCRDAVDVARWMYRETVRVRKRKYGMKGMYPSDRYALLTVLAAAGRRLTPRFGLVFIDEGQDISEGEFSLLRTICSDAAFDVFGDVDQNVTPWRGVRAWEKLGIPVCTLDLNYRNTNEIVEFVMREVNVPMRPLGLHGEPVRRIKSRQTGGFFRGKQGLKAVIAREEDLPLFKKRGFRLLPPGGKLSKTAVNVLSVYASKGLEFSAVAVYDRGMTRSEKYIAYTRALRELAIVED